MSLESKRETLQTPLGTIEFVTLDAGSTPFASEGRKINGLPADAWLAEKSVRAVTTICEAISAARQVDDKGLSEVLLTSLRFALVSSVELAGWCLNDPDLGDMKTVELLWKDPDGASVRWGRETERRP